MESLITYLPFLLAVTIALFAISLAVLIRLDIKALIKYLKSNN